MPAPASASASNWALEARESSCSGAKTVLPNRMNGPPLRPEADASRHADGHRLPAAARRPELRDRNRPGELVSSVSFVSGVRCVSDVSA